ncbi:helix-turn-helix domain-containing protein [Limibacter armeniacum]|uniref:helix-turn-helix domain-containing protein n=1 Tax=Limibacter armeniacum TaxID=466084 RepID=UPI002FE680F9
MRLHNEHRRQISLMLAEGKSLAAIARKLGVHRSTVSREVARNSESDGDYLPYRASRKAHLRRVKGGVKSYWNRQQQSMPKGGVSYRKRYYSFSSRYIGLACWGWMERGVQRQRKRIWWRHDIRTYRSRVGWGYRQRKAWLNKHRNRNEWDMYCENSYRYLHGLLNFSPCPSLYGDGASIRQKPYSERPYVRYTKYWWWLYKGTKVVVQEVLEQEPDQRRGVQVKPDGGMLLSWRNTLSRQAVSDLLPVGVRCRSGPDWAA